MQFKSIFGKSKPCTFRDALFHGLADDGGLFVPENLSPLSDDFLKNLSSYSLLSIAEVIMRYFIDDIPDVDLKRILKNTFSFEIPLVKLSEHLFLLELFHGPTLAFKDVGARFMAETLGYYLADENKHMTIVVATSGDTGSAVAKGFYRVPNISVFILYPENKVSVLQEKQMTTLGENIHAVKVAGTFDDCQSLVKLTLLDKDIKSKGFLTTANSINVGRMLPQVIYYFWGIAQGHFKKASVIVPSGNFGNLTAAAYARALGAPISQLVAATNQNDIVPKFLQTGVFKAESAIKTLSNAMDVGNPNNFPRLKYLYQSDIRKAIEGFSVGDEETLQEIRETYDASKYILDPHTAVGVYAAKHFVHSTEPMIVAATAHPGKFPEVIKRALQLDIPLPYALEEVLNKKSESMAIAADYQEWKRFLLGLGF